MTYEICDSCETVAYCMKSGCVPKQPRVVPFDDADIYSFWARNKESEQAAQPKPAFHGFMDKENCTVNLCFTPHAPGGPNNELPTAYYTQPPAQPQQEPVAWINSKGDMTYLHGPYNADDRPLVYGDSIYTTPPAQHEQLTELQKDATNLLFALHDAWPYVHQWCTIESRKKNIQSLMRKHGDFADTSPPAQRKPLTLHEIVKLTQGLDLNGISWVDVIRAVETAHGIKE